MIPFLLISVVRKYFTEVSTIGKLFINGRFVCYTLEDKVRPRGVKVYGKTAIPKGRYPVSLHLWRKYNKIVPKINNVPGFDGILIHTGSTAVDTNGCLLLGMDYRDNKLLGSTQAFNIVNSRINETIKNGGFVSVKFENRINKVKTLLSVLGGLTLFGVSRGIYLKGRKNETYS